MPAAQAQWISRPDELFGGGTRCVGDLHASMTDPEAHDIAEVFQALSSPTRVRLVAALREAPCDGASVGDLVERVGWSRSTVSHHLRVLTAAGLVHRSPSGPRVRYRVNAGRFELVLALVGEPSAISR